MLGLTRFAANSSRMMPKDSGNSAPPMPWTTRATISTPMVGASAASRHPSSTATRTATRVRFLPIRSPTRPRIGVKTEADSRYAVITQVAVDWEVSSACWTVGRAGAISDWSMENTPAPVARTAKVRRVDLRGMKSLSELVAAESLGPRPYGPGACPGQHRARRRSRGGGPPGFRARPRAGRGSRKVSGGRAMRSGAGPARVRARGPARMRGGVASSMRAAARVHAVRTPHC